MHFISNPHNKWSYSISKHWVKIYHFILSVINSKNRSVKTIFFLIWKRYGSKLLFTTIRFPMRLSNKSVVILVMLKICTRNTDKCAWYKFAKNFTLLSSLILIVKTNTLAQFSLKGNLTERIELALLYFYSSYIIVVEI